MERVNPAAWLFVQVGCLLLLGIALESGIIAAQARVPHEIYTEASFTLALFERAPTALVLALLSLCFAVWLFIPAGRGRLAWGQIDRVGGLRWLVFVVAASLAWAYSGNGYNYYLDRSHLWDRLLLVLLLFGTLRSPLLIAVFLFELLVSRGQFSHPISANTPVVDEMPVRVLGMVLGCAVWNALMCGLASIPSNSRIAFVRKWSQTARVQTRTLVYSILCLIGSYYAFAGLSKLLIGTNLTDWVRFSHMENLFVGSYVMGWLNFLPETRMLELAESVRAISVPISAMTVLFEFSTLFILLHRRGTLLLLGAVSSMHLGIFVMTGIIFWEWMTVDVSLLAWMWFWRDHEEVRSIYSRRNFLVSLVLVVAVMAVFGENRFAWWNTKWKKICEIEALDQEGTSYRVDYADFSPYILFGFCQPAGSRIQSKMYGTSPNQKLMQRLEEADPADMQRFFAGRSKRRDGEIEKRKAENLDDFMGRHFQHRNREPGRSVFPFLFPPPSSHNRFLSAPNLYRNQAPVVEVRIRFVEILYSGSKLHRMRDEIVHTIRIP